MPRKRMERSERFDRIAPTDRVSRRPEFVFRYVFKVQRFVKPKNESVSKKMRKSKQTLRYTNEHEWYW